MFAKTLVKAERKGQQQDGEGERTCRAGRRRAAQGTGVGAGDSGGCSGRLGAARGWRSGERGLLRPASAWCLGAAAEGDSLAGPRVWMTRVVLSRAHLPPPVLTVI